MARIEGPRKDLGVRYECFECGTKFYDLHRPVPTCPKCGADQREDPALGGPSKAKRHKAAVKRGGSHPAEAVEEEPGEELDDDLDEDLDDELDEDLDALDDELDDDLDDELDDDLDEDLDDDLDDELDDDLDDEGFV